jgi:hypothetical protein
MSLNLRKIAISFLTFILSLNIVHATQYGWLKISVVDCECGNPIEGAKVCVERYDDPCDFTDKNGLVSFYLPIGSYNVQISKDGYNSKNVNVRIDCSQTVEIRVCLERQYGNLEVRVVDCTYRKPIGGANVCVTGARTVCALTNEKGEVYFQKLPVGEYSLQVSKDGYYTAEGKVKVVCSQTSRAEICLNRKAICKPGSIRNRMCISSFQLSYEKCKADGSGWEIVTESCPSDQICRDGYCTLEKDGWYETSLTRCNLEGKSCGEGKKEVKMEYRDYICFGVTCSYVVTQSKWVHKGSCYVPCQSERTFSDNSNPIEENKDGWYDVESKCELNGALCGYGVKKVKQEQRKYMCIGNTCTYIVTGVRWISAGQCYVSCPSLTFLPTNSLEKDGWYETGKEKCELNGATCGYGKRLKEQEYRDYTCFGVTCTYQVTAKRWVEVGTCYKKCNSFDCNSLDGWYAKETYCETGGFECGSGIMVKKEEYRDYPSRYVSSPSECREYKVVGVRWTIGNECYKTCMVGSCQEGFCR